jgi:transcriptional/translational regulatory protein YebC/TACO1
VAWIFEKRGVIVVDGERYTEDDLIAAIDAGAEDVQEDGDLLKVIADPSDLAQVREALDTAGVQIQSSDLAMEPRSVVEVDESAAPALLRLLDALEEHDDVNEVRANFDIPQELLEQVAA